MRIRVLDLPVVAIQMSLSNNVILSDIYIDQFCVQTDGLSRTVALDGPWDMQTTTPSQNYSFSFSLFKGPGTIVLRPSHDQHYIVTVIECKRTCYEELSSSRQNEAGIKTLFWRKQRKR